MLFREYLVILHDVRSAGRDIVSELDGRWKSSRVGSDGKGVIPCRER